MAAGLFITFEGGEGAGKSTQARGLADRLRDETGREVLLTREPGGSPGAEALRDLLVRGAADRWSPVAETLILYAARTDHLERTIRPALARGAVVISDRFADSTRAYQGAGGGADGALIAALEQTVVGDATPDLTLVFDLPVEVGLSRAHARGDAETRFESKGAAFHARLREGFLRIAASEPDRCVVIDARRRARSGGSGGLAGGVGPPGVGGPGVSGPVAAPALHPRDDFSSLERVEAPAAAFEDAQARGRLHHAWLLTGPKGVGKARFAYRAARRLLGAAPGPEPLGAWADDPVARLMSARAHPDFLALERDSPDAKARRNIPVDEARRLPEFFAKAPAIAPYRVAVIDAADDLNVNAANAVLKTLEEPPPRGVLLLVSHAPGRLLDTIRSRCRRLAFSPWPVEALAERLQRTHGLDAQSAQHMALRARGSPGQAEALAVRGETSETAGVAALVMDGLDRPDAAHLLKLVEGFRGGEGAERFAATLASLADGVRARAEAAAESGEGAAADAWAIAWRRVMAAPVEAEALNLDRADAFWSVFATLRAAARAR